MDRDAEIERLTRLQIKGRQAEQAKEALLPLFEAVQRKRMLALIAKTRSDGEVCDSEVWKLIALDDLFREMTTDAAMGRQADKTIEELTDPRVARGGE